MFWFLNRSSLQSLYAARLTRAYLGASNPERHGTETSRTIDALGTDGLPFRDYRPQEHGGPLHIINVTINETIDGRSQIEQRDRRGVSLAISSVGGMNVGTKQHALWDEGREQLGGTTPPPTGFRLFPTGARVWSEQLRLDEWVGISGAAFSTGLGARTNLGLSVLCGLFNVRLGYWWDSGQTPAGVLRASEVGWLKRLGRAITAGFPVQMYLLDEITARFHGTSRRQSSTLSSARVPRTVTLVPGATLARRSPSGSRTSTMRHPPTRTVPARSGRSGSACRAIDDGWTRPPPRHTARRPPPPRGGDRPHA